MKLGATLVIVVMTGALFTLVGGLLGSVLCCETGYLP